MDINGYFSVLAFTVFFVAVFDQPVVGDARCQDVKCLHPNITNAETEEVTPSISDGGDDMTGNYGNYGNYVYDGENSILQYDLGAQIKVTCNHGYELTNNQSEALMTCLNVSSAGQCDGRWNQDVSCVPAISGCNATLRNARLTKTCHDVTGWTDLVPINRTSCIRCEDGFQLIDEAGHEASSLVITCLQTGQWEESVRCRRKVHIERKVGGTTDCSDVLCIHPNITNGLAETPLPSDQAGSDGDYDYYGNYDYGEDEDIPQYPQKTRMKVRCDHGYLFNRTSLVAGVITCHRKSSARGKCDVGWNANTTTLCEPITCQPNALRNARLTDTCDDVTPLTDPVPMNSTACLGCETGFKMVDAAGSEISSLETTCLETGQWDAAAKCVNVIACPDLADPPYGSITSFDNLTRAEYSCRSGFLMYGEPVQECEQGAWSRPPPKCRHKTSCLVDLPHGNITFSPDKEGHGPWAKPGTPALYTCDPGFTHLTDDTSLQCSAGKWRPLPRCVPDKPFNCPEFPAIRHGTRTLKPSRILPGTEATLTCNRGYALQGSAKRVCLEDGSWSGQAATCASMTQCPTPPAVDKAYPPKDGVYLEGDVIRYRCKAGYEIHNGASRITCTNQGTWSAVRMSCRAVHCGRPSPIPNTIAHGQDFRFGDAVSYTCKPGYKMTAGILTTRLCQPNRRWTTLSMKCEEARCPALPSIDNATLEHYTGWSLRYRSIYRYICQRGYKFSGADSGKDAVELRCQGDQTWSRTVPACEVVKCPTLEAPANGYIKGSSDGTVYVYGSAYAVGCNHPGYKLQGKEPGEEIYRVCQHDGQWSEQQGVCQDRKIFHSRQEWSDFFNSNQRTGSAPWREHGYQWKSSCRLSEGVKEECLWSGWHNLIWYDAWCNYNEIKEYGSWGSYDRKQVWYALLGVKVEKFGNQCCYEKNGQDYPCYESYTGDR